MACGCNREYKNQNYSWKQVDYTPVNCVQTSRNNNGCKAYNGTGFEWLAAMQREANGKCSGSNYYEAFDGCTDRERYLLEVLMMLAAWMRRNHHS